MGAPGEIYALYLKLVTQRHIVAEFLSIPLLGTDRITIPKTALASIAASRGKN